MDNTELAMNVTLDAIAVEYAQGSGKYLSHIADIEESLAACDVEAARRDVAKLRKYAELRARGLRILRTA